MRKLLVIIGVLAGLSSCGREIASSELPRAVDSTFKSDFPIANGAKWKKKSNGYHVDFHNGPNYSLSNYGENGKLKKTMRQCTVACLESN